MYPVKARQVCQGLFREAGIVLLAAEALFLGGEDDLAVPDQADRAVVVEGRDSQDQHPEIIAERTSRDNKRCRSDRTRHQRVPVALRSRFPYNEIYTVKPISVRMPEETLR